jgi:hypothetical protein
MIEADAQTSREADASRLAALAEDADNSQKPTLLILRWANVLSVESEANNVGVEAVGAGDLD